MKKLITAVLAACLSMAVAGSYAAEDAMKKDKKDEMKKDEHEERRCMGKGDGHGQDDAKKKKDKDKKDEREITAARIVAAKRALSSALFSSRSEPCTCPHNAG